ncbi:hypothetical protein HY994_00090 [Candidatus Micrarchaeota archaeon]|nr:hypothetical protein [Candidatus Micrarchaeota archaeon]
MADILTGIPLSASEKFILRSAHELVFIKDQRDVYRRKGVYLSLPFFQTAAKWAKQDISDVAYWTLNELRAFLVGGNPVPLATSKKRKAGFLLYEKEGNYSCLVGPEAKRAQKAMGIQSVSVESAVSVTGLIGSKGLSGKSVVQGTAKIVRTVADLDKVKRGDVMVAITTHPDFVPAMSRACAIVTDEGGITSHAAIVSREFGIPCVVGTKKATAVFKDGDRLQVDSEKGVVKKIT